MVGGISLIWAIPTKCKKSQGTPESKPPKPGPGESALANVEARDTLKRPAKRPA